MSKNLAASIRTRLLEIAKAEGSDFNQVLVRFALERILYRLSQSNHADHFLLKGALLFALWYNVPHRHTRDADLLGFGPSDLESIEQTFRSIASISVQDGIAFDPDSVSVAAIRETSGYSGVRVLITAELARARVKTQIDIGFGDAVTPHPVTADYPRLLKDLPAARLNTYPVYTVIAEKIHAIALLGMTNTRLKDYLDLYVLFERETLDTPTLLQAVTATFNRRGMEVPDAVPTGLTDEFATDPSRQAIWHAFLNKNEMPSQSLGDVVGQIRWHLQSVFTRVISDQGTAQ
jgi:predicted nucleotidyltransferase component of viral defense system